MPTPEERKPVPGSEREPMIGARAMRTPDPGQRIQVSVVLRARPSLHSLSTELSNSALPAARQHLTREEYAAKYGADPDDVAKVTAFANRYHLDVVDVNLGTRTMRLSGTIADFSAAFGVSLQLYEHAQGTYRGRSGAIFVPKDLADIVQGVFGLDDRPAAEPRAQRKDGGAQMAAMDAPFGPHATGPFTSQTLGTLYNFPNTVNGAGQTIGIIELGGGFTAADLTTYFTGLGITPPTVTAVSVDGATNNPADPTPNATLEVMLDIEVAGAVAPGANIVCYFCPNSESGFLDGVNAAIGDTTNNPTVISISWGSSESNHTVSFMNSMNTAFQNAGAVGITVTVASADNGSGDGVGDGRAHADFPASAPFALACGGTMVSASGSTITGEVTWNDGCGSSGGGVSDQFGLPTYQTGAGIPVSINPGARVGRGVPDVSGHAANYSIRVSGSNIQACGTSAVAPLWAGLVALLNQSLGNTVGFLNPFLYQNPTSCRDITSGNNGGYSAGVGWDACTGLGSPNAAMLLALLTPIPVVTWSDPAPIVYGTPLSATQLNATAVLPGFFTYTPTFNTILNAGAGQTLSVLFTPTVPGHPAVTKTVHIDVLKATPTLTWANPPNITYGTALDSTQLNASASWIVGVTTVNVPGMFTYNPTTGAILNAGTRTLTVTFAPNDTVNYNTATASVTLTVLKATPIIVWANPPDIDHGTALDNTQLDATARWTLGTTPVTVAGMFNYNPPSGTVLPIGPAQTLSVAFTPTDTANYNPASASVVINVLTGYPIIMSTVFSPTVIPLDIANPLLNVAITVKNDSIKPHVTEGPGPDFEYSEGDTYQTKGFPSIDGAYRVGVDLQETTYTVHYLYRWGFGKTLAPGETVQVNGCIRMHNVHHNGHYYAGMIEETDKVLIDNQGTTLITVVDSLG